MYELTRQPVGQQEHGKIQRRAYHQAINQLNIIQQSLLAIIKKKIKARSSTLRKYRKKLRFENDPIKYCIYLRRLNLTFI